MMANDMYSCSQVFLLEVSVAKIRKNARSADESILSGRTDLSGASITQGDTCVKCEQIRHSRADTAEEFLRH